MKVLLTGSTGHLGGHTARELEAQGHEVVALVRTTSDLRGLAGSLAQRVQGDVLDGASVMAAARGCEAIVHEAAVFSVAMDKPDEIIRPAVEGTRHVLEAARRHGIRRVVYTSSIAAIGFGSGPEQVLNGSIWNEHPATPYLEAKTRSERLAHEMARVAGIELVAICPTGISGAGDYRLTPTQRIALGMLTGQVPARSGGINLVAVTDVARLHVQALTRGRPFGRYIAGGENITFGQMAELLAHIVGHPLPAAPAPPAGQPPMYSWYDQTTTRRDFDYDPQPAEQVLRSVVAWYAELGVFPPKS